MISQNIVLIETIDSSGTGFLYPCKCEANLSYQYFIVFTNSHVLQNIGLKKAGEPAKNYKEQIILSFYDSLGNKVSQEKIKEIRVYNSGNFMRKEEDIAALLVAVSRGVPMALETRVCHRQLANRECLYIEGYPGVLLGDEVCSKIQLEGIEKRIFPANEKMGIYQIKDDYHWYNNYKDRNLLQGMSGSLVYLGDKTGEILGMAQSVSDIHQGENPFKLMYYIKFSHILKHLRKADCIIFSQELENQYQIQWIYELPDIVSNKKVTLLLLGGSGAGKSSFAKDFAFHGDQICSTNDGQTTRTKVIYNYRIQNMVDNRAYRSGSNSVDVKILTKEEFVDRMMENVGQRPALLIVRAIFNLEYDTINDAVDFLENCYSLLHVLKRILNEQQSKSWWPDRVLDDIREGIHHLQSNRKMIKCYEDIIETLCTYLPVYIVKYLLNDFYIMRLRKHIQQEKQSGKKDLDKYPDIEAKEVLELEEAKEYCNAQTDNLDVRFKEFQEAAVKKFIKKKKYSLEKEKITWYLKEKLFREAYLDSLLAIEGHFALEEFRDILPKENIEEWFEQIDIYRCDVTIDKQKEDIDWENRSRKKQFKIEFSSQMEVIYGELHGKIRTYLISNYAKYGMAENYLNIHLNLDDMDDEKRKLLQRCLQVTAWGSLTGIVNYVDINDMISDEYASILKDLQIGALQLIDTCGLDHVGMLDQQVLKNHLYETLYYYNENERIKLEDISVLYLKKLDSGKPDELRQVFPCVREVFPASPVYCVFTGIDIFYRTTEEIDSLNWKCSGGVQPKAVSYLLSGNGRKLLECKKKDEWFGMDGNMYLVMRNNLIPYCGKKHLVFNNYSYYRNNVNYIRKLLASIVMKEYSSLEIIDTALIDVVLEVIIASRDRRKRVEDIIDEKKELTEREGEDLKKKINKILEDTKDLIRCIFSEASLKSYNYRYNTKRADILSFCKRKKLGYYGTYRHRMDQRFHEGYARAVEKEGIKLAKNFAPSQAALIGALKNMETTYLGSGNNLTDLEPDDKNAFRITLEKMYKRCYEYNPFQKEKYASQEFEKNRDKIFDEIFDFCKGLTDEGIMEDFMVEFIFDLKKQIHEDNRQKSENLLKLNPKFTEILGELEKDYFEKYRTDNENEEVENQEEMKKRFMKLMNYYFHGYT